MDPVLTLVAGLALGAGLGAVVGRLLARGRSGSTQDAQLAALRHAAELDRLRADQAAHQAGLQADAAAAQATAAGLRDQLAAVEDRFVEFVDRTEAERDARTRREADESKVLQALSPVQESLRVMQAKVAEIETQRARQHGEIAQSLRTAAESEERLRSTAESLASALRSNSTRGVWGETQLRSVVEAAGLMQRVDFDVQSSITSDAGAGRPDMIVRLPGGKSIAVDAKVPFTSYIEAAAIPATASDAELARKATLLKAHVKAVRDHISALGSKAYWDGLPSSPEMVIAFIPSESLVSSALEADPSIMEFAFSKRVALSSPVTLWSVLKTVAFSWQQDVVTEEAKTLFDLSKELYGRLSTMAGHIDKLGRSIERSVKDYNGFIGSLERQVLPSARKLNALDESKLLAPLTPIEESKRELTALEFTAVELPGLESADEPLGTEELAGGVEPLAAVDVVAATDARRLHELNSLVPAAAEFDPFSPLLARRDQRTA